MTNTTIMLTGSQKALVVACRKAITMQGLKRLKDQGAASIMLRDFAGNKSSLTQGQVISFACRYLLEGFK